MTPTPRTLILSALSLVSLYLLLHLPSGSPPAPPRESPAEGQFTRRIVAVGDLHGDLVNMKKVLTMAGVIDRAGNWSGDVDFFVQTGDIVDRGDDTLEMYELMDKLREQAISVGGRVLSHLGNHEFMNAIGDWRYVPPSEIQTFGGVAARQKMLSSGWLGKSWRANYTVTSRLPLHPSLGPPNSDYDPRAPSGPLSHAAYAFLHGGLAPTFSNLTPYPSAINALGKSLLKRLQDRTQPPPHPPNPYPGLPQSATAAEHELYGADGPVWYRGWAMEPDSFVCNAIEGVLAKTGVRRMIMGHTPNFEHMVSRCGGKIIIIDTGISKAYGGALSALSVTYTLTPQPATRFASVASARTWTEHEVIKAVYQDKVDVLVDSTREVRGTF
ncbi:hypothetical protein RhiJN_03203 [Ceratobasidium sp. AG-Ba]|nr:hypothetical protein RhiJN_03203 [Ceratobasidium sp. AG-Ba]QRW04102.1 hypothetical protein RhiLY_03101 [Ceratobasidium sp. AG-Ba]